MSIGGILIILVLFATPALVLYLSGTKFLPVKSRLKLALISFFVLYGFIVGMAQLQDYLIAQDLYSYDLDGNGSFSSDEMTPEVEEAMRKFTHDTGRTYAPITGFIFSLIYVLIFFTVAELISKYVPRHT